MKTGAIEADAGALPALAPLPRMGASFQVAEMEVVTPDRQPPPDKTATRDFGDSPTAFKVINVLIVGDCDNEIIPRLAELEPPGYIPLHHRVETREDFLAALKSRAWDVIISDHVLPQFSGPEALKTLRNQGSDIPFIMVSDVFGEEKVATMIKAGASDYLSKKNLARLVLVLERELKAAQDRRRCQHAVAAVRHLAASIRELGNGAVIPCDVQEVLEWGHPGWAISHSNSATAAPAPTDAGAATGAVGDAAGFPTLRELKKRHIFAALDWCKENRTRAARLLDISPRTLRNKLHRYDDASPKSEHDNTVKT